MDIESLSAVHDNHVKYEIREIACAMRSKNKWKSIHI